MIEPLNSNTNVVFKGSLEGNVPQKADASDIFKIFNPQVQATNTDEVKISSSNEAIKNNEEPANKQEKTGLVQHINNTQNKFLNFIKGFNTVTGTTLGVAQGIIGGIAATGIVGVIGKNISNNKDEAKQISRSIKGMSKDFGKGLVGIFKFIPSIITKSPLENIKNVGKLPLDFYGKYLKTNKKVAAFATIAGLGVLAFKTIQAKMLANRKNSNVDHYTDKGHVKY